MRKKIIGVRFGNGKLFMIAGVLTMAIITAQVLSACGVDPKAKEGRAKAALEKKYGEEFEIVRVYPQKFGELYYDVLAYAVNDPDTRFSASVDTEDDGVSDAFVERRVCAQIAENVSKNLDGLQGYYYVYVHAIGPQPICGDPNIGIEAYARLDPQNRFRAEVFLVPETADAGNIYSAVTKMYAGMEYLRVDARLVVVDENKMEDVQEQIVGSGEYSFDLKMSMQDCPSIDIPFENQKIGLSESEFIRKMGGVL